MLEIFASYLSREKSYPILLITSKEGIPEWISPHEVQNLTVGTSEFTCCQRNHIFGGKVVPCDRGITRKILEQMIEAKISYFFKLEHTLRARLCTCYKNWWLKNDSNPEENSFKNEDEFKALLQSDGAS